MLHQWRSISSEIPMHWEAQYLSICKFFVTFARLQISGLFLDRSIGDIKIHYVIVRGIIIEKEVKSNGIWADMWALYCVRHFSPIQSSYFKLCSLYEIYFVYGVRISRDSHFIRFRLRTCGSSSAMVILAGRGVGRPPCLIGEAPLQGLSPV